MAKKFQDETISARTHVTGALTCINTLFHDCSASSHGGAIYHSVAQSSVKLTTTRFYNCRTVGDDNTGGAMFVLQSAFDLTRSSFVKCNAYDNGGAICQGRIGWLYSAYTRASMCLFEANGGPNCIQDAAFYFFALEITVTNQNSTNNVAPSAACGTTRSGANPPATFTRATIVNSQPQALYISNGAFAGEYVNIVHCQNPALIFVGDVFAHTLKNSVFIGHSGIEISSGSLDLVCCQSEFPLPTQGKIVINSVTVGIMAATFDFAKLIVRKDCVFRTNYFTISRAGQLSITTIIHIFILDRNPF